MTHPTDEQSESFARSCVGAEIDKLIVAALGTVSIEDEAEGYEFRSDEGDHTPNENETALLIDFGHGLMDAVHKAIRPMIALAALSPSPAAGGGVREALEALLPGPLCGESWGCPDDEHVSMPTTFGAIRRARAALDRQTGEREGEWLLALSNQATPGEWHHRQAGLVGNGGQLDWIGDAPSGFRHSKIIVGKECFHGGTHDYAFVAALVSLYRSGHLIYRALPAAPRDADRAAGQGEVA